MSIGKYSPTVSRAYVVNQNWFKEVYDDNGWVTSYDAQGYDRYGYDKDDVDRAGNNEYAYAYSENEGLYEDVQSEWGYDGNTPVCLVKKVTPVQTTMVTIEIDTLRQILNTLREVTTTFLDVDGQFGKCEQDTIEKVYAAIALIPSEVK
jgi:hypothetical protein